MLLRDKDKHALQNIFMSASIPLEVWAYGSRVNDTAHEGSDLDLVVRSRNLEKLPIDILMDLKEKIRESNIPILVELFDWGRLSESFRRNIEAQHKVLFSNLELVVHEPRPKYTPSNESPSRKNTLGQNNNHKSTGSNV